MHPTVELRSERLSVSSGSGQRNRRGLSIGAWLLLSAFVAATLAGVVLDRGGWLVLGYPLGALGVGAVLFGVNPELHLGYTWWLWLVTPLVRRLVDFHVGWNPTNPILLAPLLVTGLAALSVVRHLPKLKLRSLLPFALVLSGILVAYPLGVVRAGPAAATYGLLQWTVPVCFGFHLAVHRDRYCAFRRTTQRAFTFGVLLLGVYGLWQYLSPQPWDASWMLNSQMVTIGQPEPRLVRVFSTMNSPTPFAMMMLAGLFTLFGARAGLQWLAGVPGYAAFLLSLVRTAWLGWILAVLIYGAYLARRHRLRVLAAGSVLGLMTFPLVASGSVQTAIATRLDSFSGLSEDVSYQERLQFYEGELKAMLFEPLGQGLGATGAATLLTDTGQGERNFDSGVLDVFRTLGWAGGAELFFGGALAILIPMLHRRKRADDQFANAARAVSVALFAGMLSLNTMTGLIGVVFWGFAGLFLASRRYADAAAPSAAARGTEYAYAAFPRSSPAEP